MRAILPYKNLYHSRQKESAKLPRSWYVDSASLLPWVRNITLNFEPSLNKSVLAGFIYRSSMISHGGFEYYDFNIILAGDLSPEQERFVAIKELMHCFFNPDDVHYATDSAVALENHFRQLFDESGTVKRSQHVQADGMALWMALGVICPAHVRDEYLAKSTGPEQVANELQIPTKQAQNLLSARFDKEIAQILN